MFNIRFHGYVDRVNVIEFLTIPIKLYFTQGRRLDNHQKNNVFPWILIICHLKALNISGIRIIFHK